MFLLTNLRKLVLYIDTQNSKISRKLPKVTCLEVEEELELEPKVVSKYSTLSTCLDCGTVWITSLITRVRTHTYIHTHPSCSFAYSLFFFLLTSVLVPSLSPEAGNIGFGDVHTLIVLFADTKIGNILALMELNENIII